MMFVSLLKTLLTSMLFYLSSPVWALVRSILTARGDVCLESYRLPSWSWDLESTGVVTISREFGGLFFVTFFWVVPTECRGVLFSCFYTPDHPLGERMEPR